MTFQVFNQDGNRVFVKTQDGVSIAFDTVSDFVNNELGVATSVPDTKVYSFATF